MNEPMKLAAIFGLSMLLILLLVRAVSFVSEQHDLSHNLADIEARLTKAKTDEADLQDEARYMADPVNLEKELRGRFNYKKPGETMVIIVPPSTSTTSTNQ